MVFRGGFDPAQIRGPAFGRFTGPGCREEIHETKTLAAAAGRIGDRLQFEMRHVPLAGDGQES